MLTSSGFYRNCPHCGFDLELYGRVGDDRCSNCTGDLTVKKEEKKEEESNPIPAVSDNSGADVGNTLLSFRGFVDAVRDILMRPSEFFSKNAKSIVASRDLISVLAFALIVRWVASFFKFFWESSFFGGWTPDASLSQIMVGFDDGIQQSINWVASGIFRILFGATSVVLSPFISIFNLGVTALLLFFGLRLFVDEDPERPHSYSGVLKILAYASVPMVLVVIPGLGVVLSWLFGFSVTVIAFREVYKTTTTRAFLIVIFPELLGSIFILSIISIALLFSAQIMRIF
ncbi:MAG: hypothetical protein AB7F43_03305 [Bacteriovoracia bacterium]